MLALGGGALVGIACFLPLLSLTITFGALPVRQRARDRSHGGQGRARARLRVAPPRRDRHPRRRRHVPAPGAACALVGAAIVVYKSWTLTSKVNGAGVSFAHVSMGIGMWVALIGGGVAIASDFVRE